MRIAQLRQLPGQPKRRVTLSSVREEQLRDLVARMHALRHGVPVVQPGPAAEAVRGQA